jgi:hypothetical protein
LDDEDGSQDDNDDDDGRNRQQHRVPITDQWRTPGDEWRRLAAAPGSMFERDLSPSEVASAPCACCGRVQLAYPFPFLGRENDRTEGAAASSSSSSSSSSWSSRHPGAAAALAAPSPAAGVLMLCFSCYILAVKPPPMASAWESHDKMAHFRLGSCARLAGAYGLAGGLPPPILRRAIVRAFPLQRKDGFISLTYFPHASVRRVAAYALLIWTPAELRRRQRMLAGRREKRVLGGGDGGVEGVEGEDEEGGLMMRGRSRRRNSRMVGLVPLSLPR